MEDQELQALREQLDRLEQKVDSLMRRAWVEPDGLPYPERLTVQRFPLYSQHEEDGITWALHREAGIEHHTFVEIGCGPNGGNSGMLAKELGFRGLMVDANGRNARVAGNRFGSHKVAVKREWVTVENVNIVLRQNRLATDVDFLSIDIDGNDIWVWQAIETPARVVVMEFNPTFGPDRAVAVPYDPGFSRQRTEPRDELKDRYYGCSLRALVHMGREKGYRLVAVETVNAYFVRDDLAAHIPEMPAESAPRRDRKTEKLKGQGFDLYATVDRLKLPLVEFR